MRNATNPGDHRAPGQACGRERAGNGNARAYYNEIDPFAAAWLRELIRDGLIADGDVDTRSIEDVAAADLVGYTQCHFFAGIAGWSYALRLAGWPDDREVWTGSCPCQPFSVAGAGEGTADKRHLWPAFHRLIAERRPSVVFGEQVASAAGRLWLTGVRADLERVGYACGAADLCAAGIGAPHIRQRLYWVADADGQRRVGERVLLRQAEAGRDAGSVLETSGGSATVGMGDAGSLYAEQPARPGAGSDNAEGRQPHGQPTGSGTAGGAWRDSIAWPCRDGKQRRVPFEPVFQRVVTGLPDGVDLGGSESAFPLTAATVPGRVGLLRGYGNSITMPLAAAFVGAAMEVVK